MLTASLSTHAARVGSTCSLTSPELEAGAAKAVLAAGEALWRCPDWLSDSSGCCVPIKGGGASAELVQGN